MIPNPIRKVLSTFCRHEVQALLIGGQACIIYGASEFSRDSDFLIDPKAENIRCTQDAFHSLNAEVIAVPPFEAHYLQRGHAVHFRCRHPEVQGLRVDLMSVLRGVDPFEILWKRRKTIVQENGTIEVLNLTDLVKAKKTQRDKDWPVLRRLLEADYIAEKNPSPEKVLFWLQECRTPEILARICRAYRPEAAVVALRRPAVAASMAGDFSETADRLAQEEWEERKRDSDYWKPLRQELEKLRHQQNKDPL